MEYTHKERALVLMETALYKGKRILCVIPARGGSKGIRGKNIRVIAGRPLIQYSIELAKRCPFLYRVIVSTDSRKIAGVARRCGGDVPFLRPSVLAQDSTPMVPVLQHAVNFVEKKYGVRMDYVLLLQPTNPLRNLNDVKKCVGKIIRTKSDSVISVARVDSAHPALMKRIESGLIKPYCMNEKEGTARQDHRPYAYMRAGGIYIVRRDTLINTGSIRGRISRPYIIPKARGIGIDDEIDLVVAEQLMLRRRKIAL